ncbi:hypothetical protein [Novosphingobium sp. SG707]|uniref:hypothetical protein n=1 Tax=Novosphingobium sp. SG707 TaxID=2586996 RepID=UPI001446D25D|nr:hypothetical protein [Novosphingobium sp. SG707]NKI99608.1 hypothetical protein [Novosphingobium sp. SG707]
MKQAIHELPAVWGFEPETHRGENLVGRLELLDGGQVKVRLSIWPEGPRRNGERYAFVGSERLQHMFDDVERALAEDDGTADILLVCGEPFPADQVRAMQRIFSGLIGQLKDIGYGEC